MKRNLLVCITLLLLNFSCTRIVSPEFRNVHGLRIKKAGWDQVTVGLGITYYNPNNFTVAVKETVADIYIDSVFVGRFSQDTIVDVGKKAEFTIPLSAEIPYSSFLKLNLKDVHKRELLVSADGSTRVGKAGIFISRDIKYQGKHRLNQVRL